MGGNSQTVLCDMWTGQINKHRGVGNHSSYCGGRRYKLRTGKEEPGGAGFESVVSEWTVSTE